jgi:hypothetical protein
VDVRGKQVRTSRALTEDELRRLLAVAGKRRLAYLTLLYTGQRKSEVRALVWGDLHLDGGAQPYALFRESTTKDKDNSIDFSAERQWSALSPRFRDRAVENAWCGHCCGASRIVKYAIRSAPGGIKLVGTCNNSPSAPLFDKGATPLTRAIGTRHVREIALSLRGLVMTLTSE